MGWILYENTVYVQRQKWTTGVGRRALKRTSLARAGLRDALRERLRYMHTAFALKSLTCTGYEASCAGRGSDIRERWARPTSRRFSACCPTSVTWLQPRIGGR